MKTFIHWLFTLFFCFCVQFVQAEEIEEIIKIWKKEYAKSIEESSGEQKTIYEVRLLKILKNYYPTEYKSQKKKLLDTKNPKYTKLFELIDISSLPHSDEKLNQLSAFSEGLETNQALYILSKYYEVVTIAELNRSTEFLSKANKYLPLFKKYKAIQLHVIYTKIGIANYMLGNIKKALYGFEQSLVYSDQRDSAQIGGILMNLGVLNFRANNNGKAIEWYKKAEEMNGERDPIIRGMINENLAISYSAMGKRELAMKHYDIATDIYLKAKDNNNYHRAMQNKIGEYLTMRDFKSAIATSKEGLKYFKRTKNYRFLPIAHLKLAQIYLELKDTTHALIEVDEAIRVAKDNNIVSYVSAVFKKAEMIPADKGLTLLLNLEKELIQKDYNNENAPLYSKIGICYKYLEKYQIAEKYFLKAIAEESKASPPSPEAMMGYHQNLSVVYYDQKQYKKALMTFEKGKKYYDPQSLNGSLLSDSYLLFSNIHGKLGNYKLAYENLFNHKQIQDSLDKLTLNNEILALKQQFQTQQIEDSLKINKKELNLSQLKIQSERATNQRNTFIIFGLLLVIALVIVLVIIVARSNKQRKEANRILIEKNAEIRMQQVVLQEKNSEIIDSITYAKRLQNTILPAQKDVDQLIPSNFIIYKPKDIVAGDFYVCQQDPNTAHTSIIAAADCTGHGVPGAIVSMVCSSALKRAISEFGLGVPGEILDKSATLVEESFQSSTEVVKDGMDISLASINFDTGKLLWAGANNPLWIIRNKELIELKPDKQPIGVIENRTKFTTHTFQLEKGDRIYFITDGFADQFGGLLSKKLKSKNLKQQLIDTSELPIKTQGQKLDAFFHEWKNDLEQVDDVCIIGVEITS